MCTYVLPFDVVKYTAETERNGGHFVVFYWPALLLWTTSGLSAFLLVDDTL